MNDYNEEIRQIEAHMDHVLQDGGDVTRAEAYKMLAARLTAVQEKNKSRIAVAATKPQPSMPESLKDAIRKVGMPSHQQVRDLANGGVMQVAGQVFSDTIEWHKAAIKVFEFMHAQVNMDLFKDDLKAKQIYERIIIAGYSQLHNEASGGGFR